MTLYDGDDKKCPLCRAHRGFAQTNYINGLDELLSFVHQLNMPLSLSM